MTDRCIAGNGFHLERSDREGAAAEVFFDTPVLIAEGYFRWNTVSPWHWNLKWPGSMIPACTGPTATWWTSSPLMRKNRFLRCVRRDVRMQRRRRKSYRFQPWMTVGNKAGLFVDFPFERWTCGNRVASEGNAACMNRA